MVNVIDENNVLIYVDVDFGVTFQAETPTNFGPINPDRKSFPDPVKNTSTSQVTITISVLLMRSKPQLLSEPVQFLEIGSSSSYDTKPHYW